MALHLTVDLRTYEKLAAAAVLHGHSMGDEIKQRIERSFTAERPEPKEWR